MTRDLSDLKLPMDVAAIQKCIPHRHPFLLIDRVLEAVPHERVVALKSISAGEPSLQGHFPGQPVYPGVLIVESVAQAAGVLGHITYEQGLSQCMLTEIQSARFRRPVVPGETIRIDVRVLKRRIPFFWFDANCTVDGEEVAHVVLSAYIK